MSTDPTVLSDLVSEAIVVGFSMPVYFYFLIMLPFQIVCFLFRLADVGFEKTLDS